MPHKRDTPFSVAARIADGQHGLITHRQLARGGWTRGRVSDAVRRGTLHTTPFTGVFSVGTPIRTAHQRAMAAVLASQGLLSHHWCRWLFGVGRLPNHPPDVTVTSNRRTRAGLTLHRTKTQPTPDANHGIPCTRPERMVIDCAPDLAPNDLRRLVNDVQIQHLATYRSLKAAVEGTSGRDTRALRALLATEHHGATRSLLEDLLVDLSAGHGLPTPAINVIVDGYEVDFAYCDGAVIIEADGYEFHRTKEQFEADREKWLALEANGRRVHPVSYRQLTVLRDETATKLARVLAAAVPSP